MNINKYYPAHFSEHCQSLIEKSRLVAIDLGYEYINTVHFFFADCKIRRSDSIYDFAFSGKDNFQKKYEEYRVSESTIFADSLPLTIEAEKAILNAIDLWKKRIYPNHKIEPYHIFLAACKDENSVFYPGFQHSTDLFQRLESYYVKKKGITKSEYKTGIWVRLKKVLRFN